MTTPTTLNTLTPTATLCDLAERAAERLDWLAGVLARAGTPDAGDPLKALAADLWRAVHAVQCEQVGVTP